MKPTIAIALMALTGLGAASSAARASEWSIDPTHTTAEFSVRHMMVTELKGQFGKVTGTLDLDDKDPTRSKVDVTVDAATIDTHEAKRDAHLKSPDFFDVAKHPTLTFKSTKIAKAGKTGFKVTGDLTMRGVTKPVVLDVEGPSAAVKSPMGQMIRGVRVTGKISRKDWGLNWNKALEAGGFLVGDDVKIEVDAELSEKAPPAASAAK